MTISLGGEQVWFLWLNHYLTVSHELKKSNQYDQLIYLTPDGEKFDQKHANTVYYVKNLLLICGHYKGIDERIRDNFVIWNCP